MFVLLWLKDLNVFKIFSVRIFKFDFNFGPE